MINEFAINYFVFLDRVSFSPGWHKRMLLSSKSLSLCLQSSGTAEVHLYTRQISNELYSLLRSFASEFALLPCRHYWFMLVRSLLLKCVGTDLGGQLGVKHGLCLWELESGSPAPM